MEIKENDGASIKMDSGCSRIDHLLYDLSRHELNLKEEICIMGKN